MYSPRALLITGSDGTTILLSFRRASSSSRTPGINNPPPESASGYRYCPATSEISAAKFSANTRAYFLQTSRCASSDEGSKWANRPTFWVTKSEAHEELAPSITCASSTATISVVPCPIETTTPVSMSKSTNVPHA